MLQSVRRHNIDETGGESRHASRPSVMVCLSPSPSTKRVIRTAARMVFPGPPSAEGSTGGPAPIALYVSTTGREAEEDSLLRENIQYAWEYGFEVHTIQGTDIPLAIAEYARREEVTDLFLGYSPPSITLLAKPAINEKPFDEMLGYLQKMEKEYNTQIIVMFHPFETINADGTIGFSQADHAKVFSQYAEKYAIGFVDMTNDFETMYDEEHHVPHGFATGETGVGHLNKYGHAVIAESLYQHIRSMEVE